MAPRLHVIVASTRPSRLGPSVASRTSFGGTAPENVRRMAAEWREKLA